MLEYFAFSRVINDNATNTAQVRILYEVVMFFPGSASIFLWNFFPKKLEVPFQDWSGDGMIDAVDYKY